jgi:hypothetical protein
VQSVELPASAGQESVWRGRLKRGGIVTLAVSPLAAALALRLPVCPTASLMNVPCPGCGLTRATVAALTGDLAQAFALHPLVFFLTPLYVVFMLTAVYTYVRGPEPGRRQHPHLGKLIGVVMSVALVLMIGVWAARFFGYLGGPVPLEPFPGF